MSSQQNRRMVKRFSKTAIFVHWLNALAFFMLYLTGLPLYTEYFHWLYIILGSAENAMILHRIFAVVFMTPLIIALIFDRQSLVHWLKQIFTWKKHDFKFFMPFAKEFFGLHSEVPKQDFYNAGEKLNSLLQLSMGFILVISGVILWFDQFFSASAVQWAFVFHNIGFALAIAVVVGHVYLSVGHPNSRVSMKGITKGDVPVDYARDHHGRWYDELKEKEKQKNKGA
ncbi:formate dehydrogenase subunit gamma [Salipaludibacillus aurantiacus]|uniref:Formate dehydrogenase subunit gamma n=1 Tax=Salipaludibacillus aurantiacus TaxID=1601833 RepID=A0A1H9S9X0_9BACI|nr:cytochrome b/b6 domain-containing protein [Salipaludibacillus aurantiacus]SER81708.1 formate dehydrogenase subunit gamma [Salipaludibacillus aurantiacus]